MLDITFQNDGKVTVAKYEDGERVSVCAIPEKLPNLLPPVILDELRQSMVTLLDMIGTTPLRIVGGVR